MCMHNTGQLFGLVFIGEIAHGIGNSFFGQNTAIQQTLLLALR